MWPRKLSPFWNVQLGYDFLQRTGLTTQVFDLVRCRGPGGVASQSLLPGLKKVLRPTVIEVLDKLHVVSTVSRWINAAFHRRGPSKKCAYPPEAI
jgi:hypothetical protein